jgi:hypothetical protein
MSDDDVEPLGDKPDRPKTGNERSRELRDRLLKFVTEAERIKGRSVRREGLRGKVK